MADESPAEVSDRQAQAAADGAITSVGVPTLLPRRGARPGPDATTDDHRRILRALLVIVGLATMLRVWLVVSYWPSGMDNGDAWARVVTAQGDLFSDPLHTAGHAIFLRAVRLFSSSVLTPTLLQHLFGLVAVLLLFQIGWRLGLRAGALVAPAVMGLSLDRWE